jgi:hypothetical protein
MATKVSLREGSRHLGQAKVFDADPSFALLEIAFPDARRITHDSLTGWTVDVGDAAVPAYAD